MIHDGGGAVDLLATASCGKHVFHEEIMKYKDKYQSRDHRHQFDDLRRLSHGIPENGHPDGFACGSGGDIGESDTDVGDDSVDDCMRKKNVRIDPMRVIDEEKLLKNLDSLVVAYQGEPGSYSNAAIFDFFGQNVGEKSIGLETFDLSFEAVNDGKADCLFIPVENTLGGTIHSTYDNMLHYNMFILGEFNYQVRHCLLVKPEKVRQGEQVDGDGGRGRAARRKDLSPVLHHGNGDGSVGGEDDVEDAGGHHICGKIGGDGDHQDRDDGDHNGRDGQERICQKRRRKIRRVISHRQALAQCDYYIRQKLGAKPLPVYDTAGAAKMLSSMVHGDDQNDNQHDYKRRDNINHDDGDDRDGDNRATNDAPDDFKGSVMEYAYGGNKGISPMEIGAIASEKAAQLYGLEIYDRDIQQFDSNYTRFLLLVPSSHRPTHRRHNIGRFGVYSNGRTVGREDGHDDGHEGTHDDCHEDGHENGHEDGNEDGHEDVHEGAYSGFHAGHDSRVHNRNHGHGGHHDGDHDENRGGAHHNYGCGLQELQHYQYRDEGVRFTHKNHHHDGIEYDHPDEIRYYHHDDIKYDHHEGVDHSDTVAEEDDIRHHSAGPWSERDILERCLGRIYRVQRRLNRLFVVRRDADRYQPRPCAEGSGGPHQLPSPLPSAPLLTSSSLASSTIESAALVSTAQVPTGLVSAEFVSAELVSSRPPSPSRTPSSSQAPPSLLSAALSPSLSQSSIHSRLLSPSPSQPPTPMSLSSLSPLSPSELPLVKISIVFSVEHRARCLYNALSCFALRGINLTKIESRPMPFSLLHHLGIALDYGTSDRGKVHGRECHGDNHGDPHGDSHGEIHTDIYGDCREGRQNDRQSGCQGVHHRSRYGDPDGICHGGPYGGMHGQQYGYGHGESGISNDFFYYIFYADVVDYADSLNAIHALRHLSACSRFVHLLGLYPCFDSSVSSSTASRRSTPSTPEVSPLSRSTCTLALSSSFPLLSPLTSSSALSSPSPSPSSSSTSLQSLSRSIALLQLSWHLKERRSFFMSRKVETEHIWTREKLHCCPGNDGVAGRGISGDGDKYIEGMHDKAFGPSGDNVAGGRVELGTGSICDEGVGGRGGHVPADRICVGFGGTGGQGLGIQDHHGGGVRYTHGGCSVKDRSRIDSRGNSQKDHSILHGNSEDDKRRSIIGSRRLDRAVLEWAKARESDFRNRHEGLNQCMYSCLDKIGAKINAHGVDDGDNDSDDIGNDIGDDHGSDDDGGSDNGDDDIGTDHSNGDDELKRDRRVDDLTVVKKHHNLHETVCANFEAASLPSSSSSLALPSPPSTSVSSPTSSSVLSSPSTSILPSSPHELRMPCVLKADEDSTMNQIRKPTELSGQPSPLANDTSSSSSLSTSSFLSSSVSSSSSPSSTRSAFSTKQLVNAIRAAEKAAKLSLSQRQSPQLPSSPSSPALSSPALSSPPISSPQLSAESPSSPPSSSSAVPSSALPSSPISQSFLMKSPMEWSGPNVNHLQRHHHQQYLECHHRQDRNCRRSVESIVQKSAHKKLKIGIIGFGNFGQFLGEAFLSDGHDLVCTSRSDAHGLKAEEMDRQSRDREKDLYEYNHPHYGHQRHNDHRNQHHHRHGHQHTRLQCYGEENSCASEVEKKRCIFFPDFDIDAVLKQNVDVLLISTSIASFEETMKKISPKLLRKTKPLIVDVLSVKEHPKIMILKYFKEHGKIRETGDREGKTCYKKHIHHNQAHATAHLDSRHDHAHENDTLDKVGDTGDGEKREGGGSGDEEIFCDVLCTHPMFGPESGKNGWRGLPFVFECVRVNDAVRCHSFLNIFRSRGCVMVELSCQSHDIIAASSQFITHLTGRVLMTFGTLRKSPIDTLGYRSLLTLVHNTSADSFDLFYGLYQFNSFSALHLKRFYDAVCLLMRDLKSMRRLTWVTRRLKESESRVPTRPKLPKKKLHCHRLEDLVSRGVESGSECIAIVGSVSDGVACGDSSEGYCGDNTVHCVAHTRVDVLALKEDDKLGEDSSDSRGGDDDTDGSAVGLTEDDKVKLCNEACEQFDLSSRVKDVKTSTTVALHALTMRMKAEENVNVVSLAVGEPDYQPPKEVIEALIDAAKEGKTKYTGVTGIHPLRKAICAYLTDTKGIKGLTPSSIVVSNGAKQSVYQSISALCESGDEVVILTPCWVTYSEAVRLQGSTPIFVHTTVEEDFLPSMRDIDNAINSRTKLLILCNPSNPTGVLMQRDKLMEFVQLLEKPKNRHVWVLSDEIYERIVYDVHEPPGQNVGAAREGYRRPANPHDANNLQDAVTDCNADNSRTSDKSGNAVNSGDSGNFGDINDDGDDGRNGEHDVNVDKEGTEDMESCDRADRRRDGTKRREIEHVSFASLPGMALRTITVNGFAKSHAMTGFRIGYAAAVCTPVITAIGRLQGHMTSCAGSMAQWAALAALTKVSDKWIEDRVDELRVKRDLMSTKLRKLLGSNVTFVLPRGAFYILLDISKFIGSFFQPERGATHAQAEHLRCAAHDKRALFVQSSTDFCQLFLRFHKVAVTPGEDFMAPNFIRLSFATSLRSIEEACDALHSFCSSFYSYKHVVSVDE